MCDSKTGKDLVPNDIVLANVGRKDMMVLYDKYQQWGYVSDRMPIKFLLFTQANLSDNARKTPSDYLHSEPLSAAPHTSLRLPVNEGGTPKLP